MRFHEFIQRIPGIFVERIEALRSDSLAAGVEDEDMRDPLCAPTLCNLAGIRQLLVIMPPAIEQSIRFADHMTSAVIASWFPKEPDARSLRKLIDIRHHISMLTQM